MESLTENQSMCATQVGRRQVFILLFTFLGAMLLLGLGIWALRPFRRGRPYAFPDLQEITSIKVMGWYDIATQKPVEFDVPKEEWKDILSCLIPSKYDRAPAKWVTLAALVIQTTGGQKHRIGLFRMEERLGAYCVQRGNEKRKYYRGGNSRRLENLLRISYEKRRECIE